MYANIVDIESIPTMAGNKMVSVCGYVQKVLPVYDLSSESYWTIQASNWKIYWPERKFTGLRENLLAREKIYWPGNNEVYFHLTVHFITKHKQYSPLQ